MILDALAYHVSMMSSIEYQDGDMSTGLPGQFYVFS